MDLDELIEKDRRNEMFGDFLRYAQILLSTGPNEDAAERARMKNHIRAYRILKSAMNAVTTDDLATADSRVLTNAWMSLLSANTLIGRIPFRRADFNTRTHKETAPASAGWVGDGYPIPVSKIGLGTTSLELTKIGGICIFTRESVADASRASLDNINRALLNTVGRYTDVALLDPAISAVVGKNPASITSGVTPIASTGSTEAAISANIKALLQTHVDAGADLSAVVLAMHPASALHMSTLLTAGNVRAFPNLGVRGGEVFGVPVLTSVGAVASGSPSERIVAAINPEGVQVADNGDIFLSASPKAAIQMDDAPTNQSAATATGAQLVSMFQAESVALKFTRPLNFEALDGAVSYMRVGW